MARRRPRQEEHSAHTHTPAKQYTQSLKQKRKKKKSIVLANSHPNRYHAVNLNQKKKEIVIIKEIIVKRVSPSSKFVKVIDQS